MPSQRDLNRLAFWNGHPDNVGRVIQDESGRMGVLPYSNARYIKAALDHGSLLWAAFDLDEQDATLRYRTIPEGVEVEEPGPVEVPEHLAYTPKDPRVRHLFVASAKSAQDNGWCPVYDRMCAEAGAPARAELIATGEVPANNRNGYRF